MHLFCFWAVPSLIMPGTKGCKSSLLKIGVIGMGEPDGGKVAFKLAWIISILDSKGYCCIVMSSFIEK